MMKISKQLTALLYISGVFLLPGMVSGAENLGTMTLTLNGEVDLAKSPDPATPHILVGTLTGDQSMTLMTAYSTKTDIWSSAFTVAGLSGNSTSCASGRNVFVSIPGTSKKGLTLVNSTNPAVKAYVIPTLQYHAFVGKSQSEGTFVSGLFFSPPTGKYAASYDNAYTCTYLNGLSVPLGWYKQILIYDQTDYPIYFSRPVASGLLKYNGVPLYITTEGMAEAARGFLQVNVTANVKIMSTCQISNVINNNIDVDMNVANEVIRESSLTFTCTGDGQNPVFLSARTTEGTPDSTDPTKLFLNNTTTSVSKKPWVMGKTYMDNVSPAFSCKDTATEGLIKFNGQEIPLPLKAVSDTVYKLGIKWAICSDDTVPAGNYRGKTVISIYTRM